MVNLHENLIPESKEVSLVVGGQEFMLFDYSSDRKMGEPLKTVSPLVRARDIMLEDLENGFVPYMIVSPEKAEEILEKGLLPEDPSYRELVVEEGFARGSRKKILSTNSGHLNLFLNREFPKMKSSDYLVILRNPNVHGFDVFVSDGPFYRGVLKTSKAIKSDDLLLIQASKSGVVGIEQYFVNEDKVGADVIPFVKKGKIDDVLDSELPSKDEIRDVLFEVKEETEEDIEGQKIYWESVLDEAVYSEHNFERRDFNIIRKMRTEIKEIIAKPLEKRDEPYNHWEEDDFNTLEEMLEPKIYEINFFMNICFEMKKVFDSMNSTSESMEKLEIDAVQNQGGEKPEMVSEFYSNMKDEVLDKFLNLLDRKVKQEKFDEQTVLKMRKGLENFHKALFLER